MKRILWSSAILVVLLAAAIGGSIAYRSGMFSAPVLKAADETPSTEAVVVNDNFITTDARVVPVRKADLTFPIGGIVREVLVKEGQSVAAGDVLLKLESSQLQVAVAQAQASLQRAKAQLAQLQAGPREQEVASAEASVAAAQARLDRVIASGETGNIAAAQAAVSAAQANYAKTQEGPDENTSIALQNDMANAEAELRRAQRAYDQIKWRNDIGATPEAAALEKATNNYAAAKARLDALYTGTSQATVSAAAAQVRQAQAQLNTLQSTLPTDIAAAQADVSLSQAQLDLVKAGVRPEQIAAAEADVAAATAQVQQALVALAQTELRAPFAGTVARLNINPGEAVVQSSVVVRLADLSQWQIETEDIKELDISAIREDKPVKLTFDALPGLQLSGNIRYIRPIGEDNRGDIVYTAVIEPERMDEHLLWNMTAVVTIDR
ncbi:MAG: HlyD family efflux transporter periplasmic adaptor subunit [Caldilineaceae bacterium]